MTTNIVTAKFCNSRRTTTRAITQYDYGQILRIEGIELPDAYEVDFSNNQYKGDSKPQIGNSSGVKIPEEYIKTGQDIYAFIFLHAGASDGETFYWIRIPNELRPARTNEPPTPEEQSVIDETIAALNAGVEKVEGIADGMEEQIQDALQEAKDSGEFDGEDGFSPEITVESIAGGHRVTIVDAVGSSTFDIMDGVNGEDGTDGRGIVSVVKTGTSGLVDTYTITYTDGTTTTFTVTNGKDGVDGKDGKDGVDGYSPTASVTQTETGAIIRVTDAEGTTTAEISNGQDGAPGAPGISPTITVTDITGGHRITITDADGAHSFDVMDGETPTVPVQDVQVNGTSVVTDGVANVPVAGATDTLGLVKVNTSYGLNVYQSGLIRIWEAGPADIKGGTYQSRPIAPDHQHESAFYGLAKAAGSDEKNSTLPVGQYTESAKSAISQMLSGSVSISGTTPTITALPGIRYVCGEVATLDITLPASGIVDVVFTSGSTPTVLTVTPPTGMTVGWANGFDSTSLEADTLYELNIKMVGTKCLGVAGQWS